MNPKKILIALAGSLAVLSCSEGDNVIDEINDNEKRGAILRTISTTSSEVPIGQESATFGGQFEVQSQENGTLVDFVEVYVGFRDNTGGTNSKDDVLFETIDKSEFFIGEFGYPRFDYEITYGELLSAAGLGPNDVDGGDQFRLRFELVLSDGNRYSFEDNTNTITGSFFRSPFQYTLTVVCPPRLAGTWTINMQDDYGDGWQTSSANGGAGLTLTLDNGTVYEVGLCSPYETPSYDCFDDGESGTQTITVPADYTGGGVWSIPGDFYGEISFQIISPGGNTVADVGLGEANGVVTVNYCVD